MNWTLVTNSLLTSTLATLLALVFGFVAALCAACVSGTVRRCLMILAVIAMALPPFVLTNCWMYYLGNAGVWRTWLHLDIYSLGGAAWLLALLTWPVTFLVVLGAWSRLEPSLLECDLAVRGWSLLRGLLWPLATGALVRGAVLTFVLALNNFAVPAILQVKVFPAEMWLRFSTNLDTSGAWRAGWPLIIAPLVGLMWLARREIIWPKLEPSASPKRLRQQLGSSWFWSATTATAVLALISVGLPLWQLLGDSRTWAELSKSWEAGQSALAHSFEFAAAAASASIVFALALTWRARVQPGRARPARVRLIARGSFGLLLWLLFLTPGVFLGITLIAVFNRTAFAWFYGSAGIVVLAFCLRYLAWAWTTVGLAARSVDRDLTDAARLEGATSWQIFRLVRWPQMAPQVAAAWYIVFLLCLWDVESMYLVVPPGGETLALRIFNMLHYGHNPQVNALCGLLLGLALLPLLAWWLACLPKRVGQAAGLLVSLGVVAGCSPSEGGKERHLESQLFTRAQIVGTRGVGVGQFNKPRSVAVDGTDNLYVVDMTGRVQKFTPAGRFELEWQMPQTDLGKPKGMCRDEKGNVVVLEPHYQRVNFFSPQGKLLSQWGSKGTNAGQFNLPRSVAVNSHGEVYVSEYGLTERIQCFAQRPPNAAPEILRTNVPAAPGPGAEYLFSFGRMGSAPGEFNRAEGICVDAQDRVYVADSCNHRIQVFKRDGTFLRAYGRAGSGKGELSYPYDIQVDARGRQYVCEFGNSRIQVFDANDQPLEMIGRAGGEPGQFNNPWGIALDSRGNLYVADALNHRVQRLDRAPGAVSVALTAPGRGTH